jgi:uncharacterized protein YegL
MDSPNKKICIHNASPKLQVQMFSTYSGVMLTELQNDGEEMESKFCFVQCSCLNDFTIPPVHFVYVLDTSGSMQGSRIQNAMIGLKASCMYLPENTSISVLSFNDYARVLHHGKNPYKGHASLEVLEEEGLRAYGGTSITNALKATLEHVETIFSVSKQESIVVLFMTDGEDPGFASALNKFKLKSTSDMDAAMGATQVLERFSSLSGVFTNFVGISTEAASADMAFLAEISNGTFVSVEHGDIVDIMGSLIGLARDRIPNKITLHLETTLKLKSKDLQENHDFFCELQGLKKENLEFHEILEPNKFVPVRKSLASKMFFEISPAMNKAMNLSPDKYGSVEVTATVHVFEFGTQENQSFVLNQTITTQQWKLLPCLPSKKDICSMNYECLLLKIQKQWGALNAKYADLLKHGYYEQSIVEFNSLHAFWKSMWETHFLNVDDAVAQNQTFLSPRMDMQNLGCKIQEYIATIVKAESDGRDLASLQCRMLSNAATDRNCSMTLESQDDSADSDAIDSQVATRNSIRQISQTFASE